MNLSKYLKSLTALVSGGLGWAAAVIASTPTHITASEWLMGATVAAASFGVYAVPNSDPTPDPPPIPEP